MASYHRDLVRERAEWSGGTREGSKSWHSTRQPWRFLVGRALRLHLHYNRWSRQRSRSNTVRLYIFLWHVGTGPNSIACAMFAVILISFEISPERYSVLGFWQWAGIFLALARTTLVCNIKEASLLPQPKPWRILVIRKKFSGRWANQWGVSSNGLFPSEFACKFWKVIPFLKIFQMGLRVNL